MLLYPINTARAPTVACLQAPDDPFAAYYRRVYALPPAEMLAELQPEGDSEFTPDYQRWSTASVVVHVTREWTFYYMNVRQLVSIPQRRPAALLASMRPCFHAFIAFC